jgi:hypothetical protein
MTLADEKSHQITFKALRDARFCKVLQIHGKRFCKQCKEITEQTCLWMKYRQHPRNDDAYEKEEKWFCERCETNTVITKEIPIPTEKAMLVKLLMSLSEKYELEGTTITVDHREVRAVFRFPEHDLRKLREIAENWADRGYITAKDLLKLEKAGMRDVAKIPPRWALSKRELRAEAMRNAFS